MDEHTFQAIALKAMTDTTMLPVEIQISNAWMVVNALQLAARHPALNAYMRASMEQTGRLFQAAIVERHPDAGPLLEMGWNEAYDVPNDGQ